MLAQNFGRASMKNSAAWRERKIRLDFFPPPSRRHGTIHCRLPLGGLSVVTRWMPLRLVSMRCAISRPHRRGVMLRTVNPPLGVVSRLDFGINSEPINLVPPGTVPLTVFAFGRLVVDWFRRSVEALKHHQWCIARALSFPELAVFVLVDDLGAGLAQITRLAELRDHHPANLGVLLALNLRDRQGLRVLDDLRRNA